MAHLTKISWFVKYNPTKIEDYVFDSPEHEKLILKWIEQGCCDGNVLLSGPAGTGKSSLISVLVNTFIKSQYDFKKVKSRSVAEIDELLSYVVTQPVKSLKKIIVIEEFDKLSREAMTQLKDTYLEKYQGTCSFFATTNYISKLDLALKSRFTVLTFGSQNIEGIVSKCKHILTAEGIHFNEEDLNKLISAKYKLGLRNIINLLQVNSLSGTVDFSSITSDISNIEEEVVDLSVRLLRKVGNMNERVAKKAALLNPLSSSIREEWERLCEILQFAKDLDYNAIYELLDSRIHYLPIKFLISKYCNEIETKRLVHLSYISFPQLCLLINSSNYRSN